MCCKNIIVLIVLIFFKQILTYGGDKYLFNSGEGLSNSLINDVYQDHLGFIWVATEDGLNRFDGIKFIHYSDHGEIPYSLNNNFVTAILDDGNNNIWIGQINGLQIYNPETETFKSVELNVDNSQDHLFFTCMIKAQNGDLWFTTSGHGILKIDKQTGKPYFFENLNRRLNSKNLESIIEDKDGVFWIGNRFDGLNIYNPKTNKVVSYNITDSPVNLPGNEISCFAEDNNNGVYIGFLNGGLARFDKTNNTISIVKSANPNEVKLPVKHLLFDSKQRLWVGTDGFGLKLLNKKTNLLENYSSVNTSFDFLKSKVHSIIEDNTGNIWLGIFQKGVFLIPESPKIFIDYGYRAFDDKSIGSSCITDIEGSESNLWITTDGDGLYHLNRLNGNVEHIPIKNEKGEQVGENILTAFNDEDHLWLGRYINGLVRYNKENGRFKTFSNPAVDKYLGSFDNITVIKKNEKNQLVLGTLGNGVGRFDIKTETFISGLDIPDSLNEKIPKWILSIFIDKKGNYWIGSYVGLIYIDHQHQTLKHFAVNNGFLPHNTVCCIQNDSNNNIWAGTYGGIVRIDPMKMIFKSYNTDDGLCNNVICAIEEDEYGKLWISTHNGLARFNPVSETFINYYAHDGIQANEFSRNSVFKSDNNELFFGGINGITQINRDYNKITHQARDVMLTEFSLSGDKVNIGEKSGKHIVLNKSIVFADTIRIREKDNIFRISFTSAEIADQSRVTYEYKLDGFDQNWRTTNEQNRQVTYTNLNHGVYCFNVRGVDKKQYSNARSIFIIIYPPWYKTVLAKIAWILLIISILYGLFLLYKESLKRRHLEKIDEMKMQFFINISHDIKTPLTLILDPLEKFLSQEFPEKTRRLFLVMYQNANRIFRLINQLMDVRRIDKGVMIVKYQKTNILSFLKNIAQSYENLAISKEISFDVNSDNPAIEVWIDPFNFEKVIDNLLSNAFKFTPPGGKIEVNTNVINKNFKEIIIIEVIDSGVGIKPTDLNLIFNRFYQLKTNSIHHLGGTGVGLNLAQSIVQLHKGKITAHNKTDSKGSLFRIELPMGCEHLPQKELIIDQNIIPASVNKVTFNTPQKLTDSESKDTKKQVNSRYKIMVVDDDDEIRSYLVHELTNNYTVVDYRNGNEAFEQLLAEKPDLLISDIMMPEMDGITLCKKIKGNIYTSHIPVILLTALSREENMVEGFETGAEMYLIKPFNSKLLKITVGSILENRRKILLQYQAKNGKYDNEEIKIQSHDEILQQKVMTIIKENISNPDLNVEMLADGIGISRVHMHRKLKELTNQSARDLIRSIRLKRASFLLTKKNLQISDVVYAVGFSNLSHFSKSFKNVYGVSPKEFKESQFENRDAENKVILEDK